MKTFLSLMLAMCLAWSGQAMAASPPIGGDFTLTDHEARPFSLSHWRGQVVLLFFGYTHCPDVCPTELSRMTQVLNGLGEQAQGVRGLLVTTDPARDRPEVLKQYVSHFHANIVGLTGSEQDIAAVARRYQVKYQPGQAAAVDHAAMGHGVATDHSQMDHSKMGHGQMDQATGTGELDHGANLFVIDADGRIAAIVPPGFPAAHVQAVVQGLLNATPD